MLARFHIYLAERNYINQYLIVMVHFFAQNTTLLFFQVQTPKFTVSTQSLNMLSLNNP